MAVNKMIEGRKVSVVMPCHNGSEFIGRAIQSVLNQSYENFEILAVDNNSTDNSSAIIEEWAIADPRVRSLSCITPGAAAARNHAISQATGQYIAFLDCDDEWDQDKLSVQVQHMAENGSAFSWCNYRVLSQSGSIRRIQKCPEQASVVDLLSKRAVIGCLTVMYDRERLGNIFMPDVAMRQDYATWLNILEVCSANGHVARGIPACLASYRLHEKSMTSNKFKAARYQWRVYRDIRMLSRGRSALYFAQYVLHGLLHRFSLPHPTSQR